MCRIMSVSNASKFKDISKAVLKMRDLVCEANRDGFGYAVSYKTSIYAEKFVNPNDFIGLNKDGLHEKMTLPIFSNNNVWSSGTHGEKPMAIVAHGRTSTNSKGMVEWSHPFVQNDQAFIHNGVVDVPRNHGYELETTNDSEYLAHLYWDKGLKAVEQKALGYYAFMNLTVGGKLEIVRDDTAQLYGAFCPELDGYIFATLEAMVIRFADAMELKITKVLPVTALSAFMVQGSSLKDYKQFKKLSRQKKMTSLERKAFKDYGKDYVQKSVKDTDNDASLPMKFSDPHYWEDDMVPLAYPRREYF